MKPTIASRTGRLAGLTGICALAWALVIAPGAAWADGGDPGADIAVSVTVPERRGDTGGGSGDEPGAGSVAVTNAQLDWGFNLETRGKSYYGACNFLMAGLPGTDGNTGGAREWGPGNWGQGLYHAQSGNAKVVGADNSTPVPFASRCLDAGGNPVRYDAANRDGSTYTSTQVRLTGGSGWRSTTTGAARIEWDAAFTVVYYDGLTYFWIEDPILTVDASGSARLSAKAGGFGMPREGGDWQRHPISDVVLGEAPAASGTGEGVRTSTNGLTLTHAYTGKAVRVPVGAPAQRLGADSHAPGAWPQSFVDFQGLTGLHSYWYSSGALIDYRKPPDPLYVSWDAANPIASAPGSGQGAAGSSGSGWGGGNRLSGLSGTGQGTAIGAGQVNQADPWDLGVTPVVHSKAKPDLVPNRRTAGSTSVAADAAIITLLATASAALIAWRRGWFRLQMKGIIS